MWIMWHMRFQMQRLDILLAIPEGATGLTSVVNATSVSVELKSNKIVRI